MKVTDKKFLAEWMGWEYIPESDCVPCQLRPNNFKHIPFHEWRPDVNHEQFTEVWNKLRTLQKCRVGMKVCGSLSNLRTAFVGVVLNNLQVVMSAVLVVLRKDEETNLTPVSE